MRPSTIVMLFAAWLVLLGAIAPVPAADAPAQAIRLTSPLDYQVFQRSTRADGAIVVCGQVLVDCDAVQARVTGRPAEGTLDERWRDVTLQADKKTFRGELAVPAGGWYKIEVKVRYGNKPDAETIAVNHVGVGEVFIVAGQSNAANHGDGHQKPASGLVAAFDGTRWVIANDPQPGASGNGGSFIPAFGDAMAERCKVPIGVANVAVGATKALHWYPKSAAVDVEVTTKASPDKPEIRKMASNGGLYANLLARVKTLGKEGFRAVLWHQGESDANQLPYGHQDWDITGKGYRRLMEDIIIACRRDAGWEVPWIVARVSYHLPNDPSSAPVRDAQKSLWDDKVALEGPDTDTLTGDLRSGVHFNAKGLQAHGRMWAEKVAPFIDKPLPQPAAGVPFDTHNGYFVSNRFEPNEPASFVVIRDKESFDKVFGAGFVMGDKSNRLPPNAFETKMVLAAIKRGKAMWKFKVKAVTAKAGVLTLRYSATSKPGGSAEFACPLIVSIPKGDYQAVEFVENGKTVKKIEQ